MQCTRCQNYGHTKTYCNRPFACVKCAGPHDTKICKKTKDTRATCILCGGSHPANYKGCIVYQELLRKYQPNRQPPNIKPPVFTSQNFPPLLSQNNQSSSNQPIYSQATYNQAVKNQHPSNDDLSLKQFLDEFKNMFNQLLQQNSMILNMLTTVINKLIQ